MKYTGTVLSRATLAILFSTLSWLPMEVAGRQCPTRSTNKLSGSITSPNYPSRYPSSTECETIIDASQGSTTTLTFVGVFQLESGCQYDNVKIITIDDTGSESVRKTHCGTSRPSPYITTAKRIKIKFRSDGSEQFQGFNLTYSTTGVCRHVLSGQQGEIEVTPEMFEDTDNCVWEISAEPGQFVQLDLNTLYKRVAALGGESIKVSEEASGGTFLRGIWNVSEGHPPDSLTSFTSQLEVTINYDAGKRKALAQWSAINTGCIQIFDAAYGAFTLGSAHIPHYGEICHYTFNVARGHTMKLTFRQMPENACEWIKLLDYKIYRGDYQERKDWCVANATNQTVFSDIGVNMRLDTQNVFEYHVQWETKCGSTLQTPGSSIPKPWVGDHYPSFMDCEWTIEGMEYHMIQVGFLSPLDLEHSNDGQCNQDYIEVLQSTPEDDLVTMGRFCGSQLPPQLKSTASRVVVRFHTDGSKEGKGYDAVWNRVCGNVYTESSGVIQSPGFPSEYTENLNCSWEIHAEDGHVIQLTFEEGFSLEETDDCTGDHIEIIDILQNGHRSSRGRWCGQNRPLMQTSMASRLLVIFHSDVEKGDRGFKANWKSESISSLGCGRVFDSPTGTFTSPNYPLPYPNNIQCRWEIQATEGHRVLLRFQLWFDLEMNDDNCGYDGVEVLESLPNGKLISYGKWCGTRTIPNFYSVSKLVVLFYSDYDKSGQGFSAQWKSDTKCGSTIFGKAGHLLSPNFPSNYPVEKECDWTILSSINGEKVQNVTLRFDPRFDLEADDGCTYDYVEISRGGSYLGRWCGTNPPPDVTSEGENLYVLFKSDKSDTGKGFLATIV